MPSLTILQNGRKAIQAGRKVETFPGNAQCPSVRLTDAPKDLTDQRVPVKPLQLINQLAPILLNSSLNRPFLGQAAIRATAFLTAGAYKPKHWNKTVNIAIIYFSLLIIILINLI